MKLSTDPSRFRDPQFENNRIKASRYSFSIKVDILHRCRMTITVAGTCKHDTIQYTTYSMMKNVNNYLLFPDNDRHDDNAANRSV